MFAENGFFQTKVEQIAKLSRVSQATVYAQCGGKHGLLRSLMDSWTQAPAVVASYQESLTAADPVVVMHALTAGYLQITKQWGDVIRMVIDVAPHDDESAAVLATARRRHNRYYGIDGLLRTRDVSGWSLERSNEWLLAHASATVLRSPAGAPLPTSGRST